MRQTPVPITVGSESARFADTGMCRVTEARFPAWAVLQRHAHDRHILAIMLHGGFETRIARRTLDCRTGVVWTEPCEELHANHVGAEGARVIVLQPTFGHGALAPFGSLLDGIWSSDDPAIVREARCISRELAFSDTLSPLALDALVVLLCARAARLRDARGTPAWLERVREFIHASYRQQPGFDEVVAVAGAPSWRVAREFRRHFHCSVGEYARMLRLNWALDQLGSTNAPLPEIALSAGYADQSHFTRACRAATGMSPRRYRQHVQRERRASVPLPPGRME